MSIRVTSLGPPRANCPGQALRKWARTCLCWLLVAAGGPATIAEDKVTVARSDNDPPTQRTGTIIDYTGEELTLEVAGGRQEKIPAERVVAWETNRVPEQIEADRSFQEDRFADAVVGYQRAMEKEKRTWLRRWILAEMIACYRNMEQFDRAGDAFLALLRNDPTAVRLDVIPLPWKARQPSPELARQAAQWLADDKSPGAQLLGASWLLSTNQRDEALEKLKQLATCPDRRIAQLAIAQRWRAESVTADRPEVANWEQQFQQIDPMLQSGPAFVLGTVLARLGEPAQAALYFLRTPILHPSDRDLAAESLMAAGEQLEKSHDLTGARSVYRELIDHYQQHALAAVAEQRLEQLPPK